MIERTTAGLIEANFKQVDEVLDDENMALSDKIKHMATLTNNISKVGALELSNRKFAAQAPDLARKPSTIELVRRNGKQAEAIEKGA